MSGKDTLRELLTIDPSVKAIAMSGYVSDSIMLEPERDGFKSAIPKPFTMETLRQAISRVITDLPGPAVSL